MPDTLRRIAASEWTRILANLGVDQGGAVLIAGPGADEVADALSTAGGPPIVEAGSHLAVLAESPVATDAEDHTGFPSDRFDLVLFLRAWSGVADLPTAVREATRLASPGGAVVLGELDAHLLTAPRPHLYPASVLYALHPELGERLRAETIDLALLNLEAVRASLKRVASAEGVRTRAVFDSPGAYVAAIEAGLWRGIERLDDDAKAEVIDAVKALLPSSGTIHDREPWLFVRGFKRA